jgi:hypothetical protein
MLICCLGSAQAGLLPNNASYSWAPGQSFRGGIPNRPVSATVTSITSLQSALNNAPAGTSVVLAAGSYTTSTTITIPANVSLRGANSLDPTATTITYSASTGSAISAGAGQAWHSRVTVTDGATQGSTSITVSSSSGISVGDLIVISQSNPSYVVIGNLTWAGAPGQNGTGNDTTRGMEQVDKVIAISGNVLTLERSLYIAYSSSPVINDMSPAVQPGVDNLQIICSADAPNATYFINFNGVDGGFVTNCHTTSPSGASCFAHIIVANSYACEFRENTLKGSGINTSGANYGIYFINNTSECLVEDNIGDDLRHSWIMAAGASGNVTGYNYSMANWESDGPNWLAEDVDFHGAEPFMNLHEGEVCSNLSGDNTHGGDAFNTFFRSHPIVYSSSVPSPNSNIIGINPESDSYNDNAVGCVIGLSGSTTITGYQAFSSSSSQNGTGTGTFTSTCYDLINNVAIGSTATLPNSLYYTSQPSWWPAGIPWPAIGPDLSPKASMIPAQYRANGIPYPTPTPTPTPTPNYSNWLNQLSDWINQHPPTSN